MRAYDIERAQRAGGVTQVFEETRWCVRQSTNRSAAGPVTLSLVLIQYSHDKASRLHAMGQLLKDVK